MIYIYLTLSFLLCAPSFGAFSSYRSENLTVRGRTQPLAVYDPPPNSRSRPFQILVTGGDVGWVGLATDVAEHLQSAGYRVIGLNARSYLSSFTVRDRGHLLEKDIPGDYQTILDWAASNKAFPGEFVLIGVSEGAGLSILAAGGNPSLRRCRGIVSLGTPVNTTLAWRWTDFPMWLTKRDPNEPQAQTGNFLRRLKTPVVMIHSTHDEWDPIERAIELFSIAPQPKRFISIDASNHRFTNRIPELLNRLDASLEWLVSPTSD